MPKVQPLGKSAENTKNAKLTELLNSLGIEAYFERPIPSAHSVDKPDVQAVHNGYYFIESKQKPATMQDAIAKAYKYKESISRIVVPNAVFGVLYPDAESGKYEVYVLFNYEPFFLRAMVNNLSSLAEWISKFIKSPPKQQEADTNLTIETLREIVASMSVALQKVSEEDIEEIFGGKSVFENILDYKAGHYPINQMRQAAAFLLTNQILFYRMLSKENEDYPDINEDLIKSPHDISLYFAKVLEKDYAATFGFDIASKIPKEHTEQIKATIKVIKALTPKKLPHDLVGKIFHDLIPLDIRKYVAAFYTNNEAAELLASLAIEKADDKVIDLACGSGTLLVASYHRKRELIRQSGRFTKELHAKFLDSDLTGVDIMPFAAHLAAVHLSLQAPLYESERVRIAVWDSTELFPDKTIPALSTELKDVYKKPTLMMFADGKKMKKEYITKGGIALNKQGTSQIPLTKADVIIMNPPFTRQERFPEEYKIKLTKRFKDYKQYLHGQMGYHGYFLLLADRFLNVGGKLAFVLPATTLRLQSFSGIKDFLNKKYHIKYVVISGQRAAFSESTQFREILLIAEKVSKKPTKAMTTIITLKGLPKSDVDAIKIAENIREKKKDAQAYTVIEDSQENLLDNINTYLGSEGAASQEMMKDYFEKSKDKFIELQALLDTNNCTSIRGIQVWKGDKVYAAKMFILNDLKRAKKEQDEWYYKGEDKNSLTAHNRITNGTVSVQKKDVIFGLRRFAGVSTIDVSNSLDYIIKNEFDKISTFITDVSKSDLEKWKRDIENKLCNFVYVGRFDISASGTHALAYYSNKLFSPSQMFWAIKGMKNEDAKILALWWNSSLNTMQILSHKKETRGAFMQLLAYSTKSFKVLNFKTLPKETRTELIKTFDSVSDKEMPSILTQFKTSNPVRLEIDKAIFKALGIFISDSELKKIYVAIDEEIEQLKNVMK